MQLDIFDLMYEPFKITKPIKLIEFFGGYGSQALALKYLGANFEHHKLCEWAVKSIQAYKDVHMTNDDTDYSKDLSIEEDINNMMKNQSDASLYHLAGDSIVCDVLVYIFKNMMEVKDE